MTEGRSTQDELPSAFDCVVVGTGLTESLVAAACARAGKSVLHLDSNAYYGARDATLNLRDMVDFLRGAPDATAEPPPCPAATGSSGEVSLLHRPERPRRIAEQSLYCAAALTSTPTRSSCEDAWRRLAFV